MKIGDRILFIFLLCVSPLAMAIDFDLGFGYGFLQLENSDGSKAYSRGPGGQVGVHYSFVDRENFRFGLAAAVDYFELDNDANSAALNEETKLFTLGGGFEMRVYRVILGLQYKYNRSEIQIRGLVDSSERYSFYTPYFEIGYELPLKYTTLRFSYRRSDSQIAVSETGFSQETAFSNSGLFLTLRFHWSGQSQYEETRSSSAPTDYQPIPTSGHESTFYSTPQVDTQRRNNSFRPRPSSRLSY